MRISDWSSDVCSSDLVESAFQSRYLLVPPTLRLRRCSYSSLGIPCKNRSTSSMTLTLGVTPCVGLPRTPKIALIDSKDGIRAVPFVTRSEEHTSELQSLMRISYAVFCLKTKHSANTHLPPYPSIIPDLE